MKKILFYLAFLFGLVSGGTSTAQAQLLVTDPGVQAELGVAITELGTVNTQLAAIALSTRAMTTTMGEMLRILHTPTPLVGLFAALDGGGKLTSSEKIVKFMPAFAGLTSVSPSATAILAQLRAQLIADTGTALATGNSELAQAIRERQVAVNIQGMAYDDLKAYGARFLAADILNARLGTATDIKQAVTLNGGIEAQILKGISMLGQTNSLIAAAIAQEQINLVHETLRLQDDHRRTALIFSVP